MTDQNLPIPVKKSRRLRREVRLEDEGAQFVIFMLADERYAVGIDTVQEILKPQRITEIPHTPEFLIGVVNLRGKIVPVVDLRRKLGLPVRAIVRSTRIIVSHYQGKPVGMLTDAVLAVRSVADTRIEPPAPLITGSVDVEAIKGIARLDDGVVGILNIDKVLEKPTRGLPASVSGVGLVHQ
jgi:purine-binding chemotaxis protein CheW